MVVTIWGFSLGKEPSLSSFDAAIGREKLIQNGRITVIDDEYPFLIEELQKYGFSVDHDKTGNDLAKLDSQLYDIAIIDFHGVGQRLGSSQGLDLLRHIRRVSPRTRVIAYTSRSLSAAESEFFRLSHVVMPKDLGLEDSMAIVEEQLKLAFSKEHLFEALLTKLNVTTPEEKKKLRSVLINALQKEDEAGFKNTLERVAGQAALKGAEYIISRIF